MISKISKMLVVSPLLILCFVMLSSCYNDSSQGVRARTTVIREGSSTGDQNPRDWRPNFDELVWYETLEEAVRYRISEASEYTFRSVDEPLALFENEERATFFFRTNHAGEEDALGYANGWRKQEGDRTYYGGFVAGGRTRFFFRQMSLLGLDPIGEVRFSVSTCASQLDATDDNKIFVWGISQTPRIHTLRIEGQSPTEVIPVILDGYMIYFWYFEDLQTDKSLRFQYFDRYTEGELIITMDD